ncbi:MAG: hypothetical protein U1E24_17935 [Phenylobacterium sp.]|nr:hypothetical protein [Phenylobacterium sp.]
MADLVPNCVLGHLPGHGVSDLSDATVDGWSKAFAVAAGTYFGDRPVILAGESLGALVCIGMGRFRLPAFRAVVAIEPPLTPSWPVRRAALTEPMATMLRRPYDDILAACALPLTVVAGDVPLEPEREMSLSPSLVSEAERTAHKPIVVSGGHQLLTENPEACAILLREAAKHIDQPAAATDA